LDEIDEDKKECLKNCFLCSKNILCDKEGMYGGEEELWEAVEREIRKHEN